MDVTSRVTFRYEAVCSSESIRTRSYKQSGNARSRAGIYWHDESQRTAAERSATAYGAKLQAAGYGQITTEIRKAPDFYYAEDYHQQYLAKNPGGYCGHGGTGVACPIFEGATA